MVGAGIAVLTTPPLGKERRVGVTVAARALWGDPRGSGPSHPLRPARPCHPLPSPHSPTAHAFRLHAEAAS
jgi:hypothetical protein